MQYYELLPDENNTYHFSSDEVISLVNNFVNDVLINDEWKQVGTSVNTK